MLRSEESEFQTERGASKGSEPCLAGGQAQGAKVACGPDLEPRT